MNATAARFLATANATSGLSHGHVEPPRAPPLLKPLVKVPLTGMQYFRRYCFAPEVCCFTLIYNLSFKGLTPSFDVCPTDSTPGSSSIDLIKYGCIFLS